MENGLHKWLNEMVPWVLMGGAGMLGRLMYHARLVQAGTHKPFTWVLLWDLPIALGAGWVAYGLATWLHVVWEVTVSLSIVVSYLGPYAIDTVFAKWADTKFGKSEQNADT